MRKKKETIEFRYYEVPQDFPLIALIGERWVTRYGKDPMHFHNYLEIGFCYFGEGSMFIGKEEHLYRAGTITVIPKNFPHHTVQYGNSLNKWEYLFIDTDKFLKELLTYKPVNGNGLSERINSRAFLTSVEEDPIFASAIRSIFEEMREKGEFYKESVRGTLASLILQLARKNPADVVKKTNVIDDGRLEAILNVLDYIEEHYQEPLKIGELAGVSHMSETHFRRVFAKFMNISPAEYLTLVRIEKACELLVKTDECLEDIGIKVGFASTGTFIRNFKKVAGVAPRRWRMNVREKKASSVNYNVSVLKGW